MPKITINELREICQPNIGRSWNETISRKFSIYITKAFLYFPISANQVTLISIFFSFSGMIILIFSNQFLFWIFTLILHFFAILLDYVDGEVARYKKTASLSGLLLDRIAGSFTTFFLYFGVICRSYLLSYSIIPIFIGIFAILSIFVPRLAMGNMYQTAVEGFIKTTNVAGTTNFQGKAYFTTLDHISAKDTIIKQIAWFLLGYGTLIFLACCYTMEYFIQIRLITTLNLFNTQIILEQGIFLTIYLSYYGILWLLAGIIFLIGIIKNQQVEGLYQHLISNTSQSQNGKNNNFL